MAAVSIGAADALLRRRLLNGPSYGTHSFGLAVVREHRGVGPEREVRSPVSVSGSFTFAGRFIGSSNELARPPLAVESGMISQMSFNVYDDPERAEAYAALEFPGTYFLAYRDLPAIIGAHVKGTRALDFGCGTGRSTRFLKNLGFDAIGIDISAEMIEQAKKRDPSGTYLLVENGSFGELSPGSFDLILAAFPFDNIPGGGHRERLLRGLRDLLADEGRFVMLGSTPEIYTREWASFTTKNFPENRDAKSGEEVRIVMKDVPDARPVVDVLWRHEDYVGQFAAARLRIIERSNPLGREDEPYEWITETSVAPWVIYVLAKS